MAFGAVVLGLALAAGLFWFWTGADHGGAAAASAAPGAPPAAGRGGVPPDSTSSTTGPDPAVHVAGAVLHPGLYHLRPDSRVADALQKAGGSRPGADLDRLNLAARVVDGQRIYVVRRGEVQPPVPAPAGTDGGDGGGPTGPPAPIDLNAADLAALDSLPGIGPATAREILAERARRGGFRSTRDLLRIPGIGDARFARLKDRVRV
ncbi:MAG TPA: ComEA family DNA-binding protein [Acidimicrobiia bacterium]|nr:ComEA family DNA-binding protein [Acidimicrobiia bacterium]